MDIYGPVEPTEETVDLDEVQEVVREWYQSLELEGPAGSYASWPGREEGTLYSAADVAWIRWIMDDLDL